MSAREGGKRDVLYIVNCAVRHVSLGRTLHPGRRRLLDDSHLYLLASVPGCDYTQIHICIHTPYCCRRVARRAFRTLVIPRSHLRDDIRPHPLLLFPAHSVNLLRHLSVHIWLPSAVTRQKSSEADPLAIRASLNEHHRGVAVPRLHGEMQWRVARAVRAVQARLGAAFWRVQQQLEEGVRAGRGCSVEGELGRAVFCVDLRSASHRVRMVRGLTSAPWLMSRRPICC